MIKILELIRAIFTFRSPRPWMTLEYVSSDTGARGRYVVHSFHWSRAEAEDERHRWAVDAAAEGRRPLLIGKAA